MLIETKHTKITAELEQRITGGYYREKLPPLRALMKEYQVSLQTISKAVKPLILSGLISPGPRGSAINHASAVRERYYAWGFLCSGSAEMTDVTHDFFQLIHRCLARDSYNMLFLDGHIGGMGYVTFRGRGANDTVPPSWDSYKYRPFIHGFNPQ